MKTVPKTYSLWSTGKGWCCHARSWYWWLFCWQESYHRNSIKGNCIPFSLLDFNGHKCLIFYIVNKNPLFFILSVEGINKWKLGRQIIFPIIFNKAFCLYAEGKDNNNAFSFLSLTDSNSTQALWFWEQKIVDLKNERFVKLDWL